MPLIKPILIVVFSIGAAFFMGRSLMPPYLGPTAGLEYAAVNGSQPHYRGSAKASVTLVEYGDYGCPPCFMYNTILNEVLQHYGNQVRLEFRHFPMMGIHPNALKAALAAEAAGEQGRYWEMHDVLLSSQPQWSRVDNAEQEFAKLATTVGLDANRLVQELEKPELRERVMADIATGQRLDIQAVPTFFLNGKRIERAPTTAEAFFELIDAELAAGSK